MRDEVVQRLLRLRPRDRPVEVPASEPGWSGKYVLHQGQHLAGDGIGREARVRGQIGRRTVTAEGGAVVVVEIPAAAARLACRVDQDAVLAAHAAR